MCSVDPCINDILASAEACLRDAAIARLSARRRCEAAYEAAVWFGKAIMIVRGACRIGQQPDPLFCLCREVDLVLKLEMHVRLLVRLGQRDPYDCSYVSREDGERAFRSARRIGTTIRWWLLMHEYVAGTQRAAGHARPKEDPMRSRSRCMTTSGSVSE